MEVPLMDPDLESIANEVFLNDLIFDKITAYLTPTDLRTVRQISSDLDKMTQRCRKFGKTINQVKLCIVEGSLADENLNFIKCTKIPWKIVQLDLSIFDVQNKRENLLEIVASILQSVTTLHLSFTRYVNDCSDLIFLLQNCPKLIKLEIDPSLLGCLELQQISSMNSEFLRIFSVRLESLEISKVNSLSYYLESEKYLNLRDNLFLLSSPGGLAMGHLKVFHWSTATSETQLFHEKSVVAQKLVENVPRLLSINEDSLEDLSLGFDVWTLPDMPTVELKKLKKLDTSVRYQDCRSFVAFLRNQPQLEELVVDMRYLLDKELLNLLADDKFTMLKRLHIKTAGLERLLTGQGIDLTFLSRLNHLEDFSIILLGRKPGGSVLTNVLGKLSTLSLTKLTIGGSFVDLEPEEKLQLLEPLIKLKCLRLRCSNFVDDHVLQWILRNMQSLQELEVTDGPFLTSFGVTGQCATSGQQGTSFASLTKLQNLIINWEGHVATEAISNAIISLPNLTRISFRNKSNGCFNTDISDFVQKIVANCPKLQRLEIVDENATGSGLISEVRDALRNCKQLMRKSNHQINFVFS